MDTSTKGLRIKTCGCVLIILHICLPAVSKYFYSYISFESCENLVEAIFFPMELAESNLVKPIWWPLERSIGVARVLQGRNFSESVKL